MLDDEDLFVGPLVGQIAAVLEWLARPKLV
jgi:hypothetical protein